MHSTEKFAPFRHRVSSADRLREIQENDFPKFPGNYRINHGWCVDDLCGKQCRISIIIIFISMTFSHCLYIWSYTDAFFSHFHILLLTTRWSSSSCKLLYYTPHRSCRFCSCYNTSFVQNRFSLPNSAYLKKTPL